MYYHYTDKELTYEKLEDRTERLKSYEDLFKPIGLWISLGSEWKEFCDEEGFSTCNMNKLKTYEVEIKMDKIRVIDTYEKLEEFEEEYKIYMDDIKRYLIDWVKVGQKYNGILFNNYYEIKSKIMRSDKFNKYLWYYAIDVNSGCIWNPESIKSFKKIKL